MASSISDRWESIGSQMVRTRALAWPMRFANRYVVQRRVARFRNRLVRHTYGTGELTISIEDPVAAAWYDHDWPLLPELACLRGSRLTAGARVFDIGAHQGVVALMIARLVEASGEVVAVEAERHNYEVALRNRNLNGAANLELIHAAGAASDGWLHFRGRLNGTVVKHGRMGLERIPALSVDSLAARHGAPDVVFVDVEGFEHEVLRGARLTLDAGRTDFFVEVHVGYGLEELGGSAQAVVDTFDPGRYRRFVTPAAGERDDYRFVPLAEHAEAPNGRFYLIALAGAG